MITIVNYGMGNLGSLLNMFKRIGVKARIESDPEAVRDAEKLVLPGVGAFDAAMHRINETPGLRAALDHKALIERVPVIGVCLGMQLLTRSSEEGKLPALAGLTGRLYASHELMVSKCPIWLECSASRHAKCAHQRYRHRATLLLRALLFREGRQSCAFADAYAVWSRVRFGDWP